MGHTQCSDLIGDPHCLDLSLDIPSGGLQGLGDPLQDVIDGVEDGFGVLLDPSGPRVVGLQSHLVSEPGS